MEDVLRWVLDGLAGLHSRELSVFVISMLPVLELRGGLLASVWLGLPLRVALPVCVGGCFLPVPFILLFINRIFLFLRRTGIGKELVLRLEMRALQKSERIQQYEFWGLLIFVGVPLPGTGAWTGALIAALLGIRARKALPAIFFGVLLSAAMMAGLSYGVLGNLFS